MFIRLDCHATAPCLYAIITPLPPQHSHVTVTSHLYFSLHASRAARHTPFTPSRHFTPPSPRHTTSGRHVTRARERHDAFFAMLSWLLLRYVMLRRAIAASLLTPCRHAFFFFEEYTYVAMLPSADRWRKR